MTSILIAGGFSVYTLRQTQRRLATLRAELIDNRQSERLLDQSERFRELYRGYSRELAVLAAESPDDATDAAKHVLNFWGGASRVYYEENRALIGSTQLDHQLRHIQSQIDSGDVDKVDLPGRTQRVLALVEDAKTFADELYELSLRF